MPPSLTGLEPKRLWAHFERILTIPHCSGNEKALGDYVISVAESAGRAWKRDKVGNVVVSKPASQGRENAPGVVLQGHLDMVCEKNSGVAHDFERDPIAAVVDGDWVRAAQTTLGADNGIGLAAALAVMEDDALLHGPLEFLFTVDEETGLTGANKLPKGFLKGTRLLNLDSEEEGAFTIGCAGGADSEIVLPLARRPAAPRTVYRLRVYGLRGGHSGIDINQGRANAIKAVARLLDRARDEARFDLVSIDGGSKHNAIPREAQAVLAAPPDAVKKLAASFRKSFAAVRAEFKAVETEAAFSFEKAEAEDRMPAMSAGSQGALVAMLLGLPHGVIAMHPEIPGLVETSTNLAIVRTEKARVHVLCSTRSSVATALEATRRVLKATAGLAGAKIELKSGYPGWTPDLQSSLLAAMKRVYAETAGREPEIMAIHAGLECGIIGEKHPGMEMISFGPTIRNPHSPDERVQVSSVGKFWDFLTASLRALA